MDYLYTGGPLPAEYMQWLLRVKVYGGIGIGELARIPMSRQLQDWTIYRLHDEWERRTIQRMMGAS